MPKKTGRSALLPALRNCREMPQPLRKAGKKDLSREILLLRFWGRGVDFLQMQSKEDLTGWILPIPALQWECGNFRETKA